MSRYRLSADPRVPRDPRSARRRQAKFAGIPGDSRQPKTEILFQPLLPVGPQRDVNPMVVRVDRDGRTLDP